MIHGLALHASEAFDPQEQLHAKELQLADRYRHLGRKRQFFLGRVAARRLFFSCAAVDPNKLGWIERTESGWPRPLDIHGHPMDVSLSISHSGDIAVCAICPLSFGAVGLDLEQVDKRADSFYEDYFSQTEQNLIRKEDGTWSHSTGTILWIIKEAVLKSAKLGLHVDARSVRVKAIRGEELEDGWRKAVVDFDEGKKNLSVIWRWMNHEHSMALALALLSSEGKITEMERDWREEFV